MKAPFACLLLTLILVACDQNVPATPVLGNTPFPTVLPTPQPSKGNVTGRIISATAGQSPAGISVYFGAMVPVNPGPDYLVSFDLQTAPKGYVYEDGRFTVLDVAAGKYVMVLWAPHDSRYIPDPANPAKELMVNVVSGQTLDLGDLKVELPR
jgi:hypothetical protein